MSCASPDDTRIRIVKILGESVRCVLDLKELLVEEREALEQRDAESLGSVASSKLALVSKIADLNKNRGEVSEQAGFGNDPDNIDALADWCDDNLEVTSAWQQLQVIAGECDVINRTNGAIVHLRRRRVLEGSSDLRGEQSDDNTYAPAGSAVSSAVGRTTVEA